MIWYVKEQNAWVISAQDMWLPGSFATKGAAHLSFRLTDENKALLSKKINRPTHGEGRDITIEDVRLALKQQAEEHTLKKGEKK